jgi:hypothetical protein
MAASGTNALFSHEMHGWLPILDTLLGHRGDVLVSIRLQLLADTNQMRMSSCGITFAVGECMWAYGLII